MIRLIALSFGTVTMVGAVLWGLDDRNAPGTPINQVSRSEPADLGLQPAVMPQGIVLSEPVKKAPTPAPVVAALKAETEALKRIRPVARPAGLGPEVKEAAAPAATISIQEALGLSPAAKPAPAAKAAPATAQPAPTPKPAPRIAVAPQPTPSPVVKDDAVTNMSYGIIGAFQAQNAPATQPKAAPTAQSLARIQALANQPVAPAPKPKPEPVLRTYQVKDGDSLPGIAFRFYGTTVAYLDIINANQDLLTSPADLRAGMVLNLPEKN